ncbi:unnamed protein product [Diamesa tonsa]
MKWSISLLAIVALTWQTSLACIEQTCSTGKTWLESACRCVCPPLGCRPGFMESDDCKCIPETSSDLNINPNDSNCTEVPCGIGHWLQSACRCVCPPLGCPPLHMESSYCACIPVPSSAPIVEDLAKKPTKEPTCIEQPCTNGHYWLEMACACVCPPLGCPPGFTESSDCACIPEPVTSPPCQSCPSSAFTLNTNTCECTCNVQKCRAGFVFDSLACECVPLKDPSCPGGFTYDAELCKCICSNQMDCRKGFIWDDELCKCMCPRSLICDKGFIWNEKECQCMCNIKKECKPGFSFDLDLCDCVCSKQVECKPGYVFDKSICDCVRDVVPICPEGFMYDAKLCKCVCKNIPKCINRQVFDENTCRCICPWFKCNVGFYNSKLCTCSTKTIFLEDTLMKDPELAVAIP